MGNDSRHKNNSDKSIPVSVIGYPLLYCIVCLLFQAFMEQHNTLKQNQLRAVGCLVGLACGDAVGTTLEFKPKGSFEPITDMMGGGPFLLEKGQWTDDTSMALCLGYSLLLKNGFDAMDQMNRYFNWYQHGYMSSNGRCFDIGNTVRAALHDFKQRHQPYAGSSDPQTAGNGSIMRLAPITIFFHDHLHRAVHFAGESSKTTHGAAECIDSCRLMAALLWELINGTDKQLLLSKIDLEFQSSSVLQLAEGHFLHKKYQELTGSGYVIESLESALWCFFNAQDFKEAVLMAANLGNDADTTAAVCGQLAGAYYGIDAIPMDWQKALSKGEEISQLALKLFQRSV